MKLSLRLLSGRSPVDPWTRFKRLSFLQFFFWNLLIFFFSHMHVTSLFPSYFLLQWLLLLTEVPITLHRILIWWLFSLLSLSLSLGFHFFLALNFLVYLLENLLSATFLSWIQLLLWRQRAKIRQVVVLCHWDWGWTDHLIGWGFLFGKGWILFII